jgi:Nucleotidyltransferase of unknown function (DUF6036)
MTVPDDSAYTGPDAAARELVAEIEVILGDMSDSCAIIGGVARNFWREPRYTKDLDFELVADPSIFEKLRSRLGHAGYAITRIQDEHEPSGPGFARFTVDGNPKKIVEFLTAKTEFEQRLIERAVRMNERQRLRVATPEDVIVLKLIANRPHDQADAIELALIDGLDWEHVRKWAAVWDVADRVDALLDSASAERARVTDLLEDDP